MSDAGGDAAANNDEALKAEVKGAEEGVPADEKKESEGDVKQDNGGEDGGDTNADEGQKAGEEAAEDGLEQEKAGEDDAVTNNTEDTPNNDPPQDSTSNEAPNNDPPQDSTSNEASDKDASSSGLDSGVSVGAAERPAKPDPPSDQLGSAKKKVSATEVKEARQRREDAEKMLRDAKAALSEKQCEKLDLERQISEHEEAIERERVERESVDRAKLEAEEGLRDLTERASSADAQRERELAQLRYDIREAQDSRKREEDGLSRLAADEAAAAARSADWMRRLRAALQETAEKEARLQQLKSEQQQRRQAQDEELRVLRDFVGNVGKRKSDGSSALGKVLAIVKDKRRDAETLQAQSSVLLQRVDEYVNDEGARMRESTAIRTAVGSLRDDCNDRATRFSSIEQSIRAERSEAEDECRKARDADAAFFASFPPPLPPLREQNRGPSHQTTQPSDQNWSARRAPVRQSNDQLQSALAQGAVGATPVHRTSPQRVSPKKSLPALREHARGQNNAGLQRGVERALNATPPRKNASPVVELAPVNAAPVEGGYRDMMRKKENKRSALKEKRNSEIAAQAARRRGK